ncbi:MAG: hypothetical protein J2P37_19340 [Ktedonobacteraceae bacterium]|nr:hypothetical protein [Ktedonobacteraceae bacterium]MBO0793393.1 hypothetical protein [Ktedonobacteraceae bacterium]
MPVLTLLAIAAQNDGLRIFLLILVLLAVILILAGGVIAVLTVYRLRQPATTEIEESNRE